MCRVAEIVLVTLLFLNSAAWAQNLSIDGSCSNRSTALELPKELSAQSFLPVDAGLDPALRSAATHLAGGMQVETARLSRTSVPRSVFRPVIRSFDAAVPQQRRRSKVRSTLMGAAIGGGLGAAYGVYYGQRVRDGAEVVAIPIFAGIGAGVGAITGLLVASW